MLLDELITEFDRGLRSMTGISRMSRPLPVPPASAEPVELTEEERAHAAGLMRVNHVGEVCAQALYQAQKLATRSPALKQAFIDRVTALAAAEPVPFTLDYWRLNISARRP